MGQWLINVHFDVGISIWQQFVLERCLVVQGMGGAGAQEGKQDGGQEYIWSWAVQ